MLKKLTLVAAFWACLGSAFADPSYQELQQRGDQALKKGDYTAAIRDFEKLIYFYPERADGYNALGYACFLDKRYERAILQFKQALTFQPGHPLALNNLMLAVGKRAAEQARELEFSEAISLLSATRNLYPGHPQSLVLQYDQGQLEFYRGNETGGLKEWSDIARRLPSSGTAQFIQAHELYRQRKLKEASEAMQAAQSKLPKEPVVLNYLALILADLGKYREAAALLSKAQQNHPPYIDLFINQANVLLRMGKLEEAVTQVTRARDLRPDFASVHLWLAALHRHTSNREASQKELGLALEDPNQSALLVSGQVGYGVWLDQNYLGVTPLGAFLKPGKHRLKVAKGKAAEVADFEVASAQVAYTDASSALQVQSEAASSGVPPLRPARSFALRDQSNHYWRSFQHFHSRPVVLCFWKVGDDSLNAQTLNGLSDLGSRYGTKIGCAVIHTDTEKKNQAISQMMSLPATYARLFDDGSVTRHYGLAAEQLPAVVVVDLDGYIASSGQGATGLEQARQALDRMISP